jgi:hypothetical protein
MAEATAPKPTVDVTADDQGIDPSSDKLLNDIWEGSDEETPEETAEETPAETPEETPVEPPEETPVGTPEETPLPEDADDPLADILADETETPVETPEETETAPEGMDEKQKHAFEQIAFEKRELKRKNAELEAQLKAAAESAQQANPDELFKVREALEAAEEKLGRLDLRNSKAFQQKYDVPIQTQIGVAQQLMKRAGLDETSAKNLTNRALSTPDLNDRVQLLTEEVPVVAAALIGMFEQLDAGRAQRAEAIQNWKQHKAANAETEARETAQMTAAKAAELATGAVEANVTGGNFMFGESKTENSKWNQDLAERKEAVRGILLRADPAEMAQYVADGVSGRPLRDLYKVERARRLKAEADLVKIRGASPGVTATATPAEQASAKERRKNMTDDELLNDVWTP